MLLYNDYSKIEKQHTVNFLHGEKEGDENCSVTHHSTASALLFWCQIMESGITTTKKELSWKEN